MHAVGACDVALEISASPKRWRTTHFDYNLSLEALSVHNRGVRPYPGPQRHIWAVRRRPCSGGVERSRPRSSSRTRLALQLTTLHLLGTADYRLGPCNMLPLVSSSTIGGNLGESSSCVMAMIMTPYQAHYNEPFWRSITSRRLCGPVYDGRRIWAYVNTRSRFMGLNVDASILANHD